MGTFDFGTHKMLKMTSLTGECCGYGRDQLVYNLEFVHLQRTFRKILEKEDWRQTYLHMVPSVEFAVRDSASAEFLRQTVAGTNPLLTERNPVSFSRHIFILFPNSEHPTDFEALRDKFETSQETVASGGYELPFVRLVKKPSAGG